MKIEGHAGLFFWMQRVAEEHRLRAIKHIEKADTLHWQTINWHSMMDENQKKIIAELKKDMLDLGWDKQVKEYFEGVEDENNNE